MNAVRCWSGNSWWGPLGEAFERRPTQLMACPVSVMT